MGALNLLAHIPEGATVGLDTSPFIYFIESHPEYLPIVRPFFEERLPAGRNHAVTSVISLAEVLVQPLSTGRGDLVERYREMLTSGSNLELSDVTPNVAERAAELRARYGLRLPDTLQLAAAPVCGCTHFVTNDSGLRRVVELNVLVLRDYLASPGPQGGPAVPEVP